MPKTRTSDVAAALPSAIEGPLTVVDPSDGGTTIQIDPAGGIIAGAGGAQPLRTVIGNLSRLSGSMGLRWIGQSIPARSVAAGTTAGIYFTPFRVPNDIDAAQPANVYAVIAPDSDATLNGQYVRLDLTWSRVTPGGSVVEGNVVTDWPVPDDWMTGEYQRPLLDNGNGHTLDGNTLAAGDLLGLWLQRDGAHASDTFNQGVVFAEYIVLEYAAKTF